MIAVLPQYDLDSTTWFYLSFLLIVAIYFRFTRFWSLRNLDLALLLAFSPALVFPESNSTVSNTWLFTAAGLLLVRLLCDGLFVRRPRMEQNLNSPGLAFLGLCALVFLAMRVAAEPPPDSTLNTVKRSENLRHRVDASGEQSEAGPAPSLIVTPVGVISEAVAQDNPDADEDGTKAAFVTARVMAVLSHVAIVAALFVLGWRLFGDPHAGLAMGLLHLLLPCTFDQASELIHVLPSALILWAIVCWRKPLVSGGLLGLACGTLFFPLFLLPLWTAFYGRKNAVRFLGALSVTGLILVGSLAFTSSDTNSLVEQVLGSINWSVLSFDFQQSEGFWGDQNAVYRLPLGAAFFVGLVFMTIWPRKKSLEYLISASTAIIVATQFWYPQQGGVFMLWYLPLVLVVVFRPRLLHYAPVPPVKNAKVESQSPAQGEVPKLVGSAPSSRVQFR